MADEVGGQSAELRHFAPCFPLPSRNLRFASIAPPSGAPCLPFFPSVPQTKTQDKKRLFLREILKKPEVTKKISKICF